MSSLQNTSSSGAIASAPTASVHASDDLDPLACELLCQKMRQWAGGVISPANTDLIRSRMRPLLIKEGADNLRQLIERASRPSEIQLRQHVVDAMTTHETMFFRDAHPFESLVHQVLPRLLESRRTHDRIRIHCAACSTGQEPYSIAMRILESHEDRSDQPCRGTHLTPVPMET
ncbi:MAG: CheR family methyltransferase [Planctomycetota bacterium]